MPFGLTEVPGAYQFSRFDLFCSIEGLFVVVYLDHILIFSINPNKHTEDVIEVLKLLQKTGLFANASKSFFHEKEIDFVQFIVSDEQVKTDPKKITKVADWPILKNLKQVQELVGFLNFYRQFIEEVATIACTLYDLLKKNQEWIWGPTQQQSFEKRKATLISAPPLIPPNIHKQFILECNRSNFASGAILSPKGSERKLHPLA